MKKLGKLQKVGLCCIFIMLVLLLIWMFLSVFKGSRSSVNRRTEEDERMEQTVVNESREGDMRGIWVASVVNLDYPSAPTVSDEELRAQADKILDWSAEYGFNTIFLQVRPCADALYKSEVYPWSFYLTGEQGAAPDAGFDPLAYWVEGAHGRGLELHAWITPYRITRMGIEEQEALSDASPAIQHPEWVVEYEENLYFDPALPEVRQMVIDGAVELVENYAIDGIHMDDYFYPGTDFDDVSSYVAYGAGYQDISDWRRENVNLLVQGLNETLHEVDPDIVFGISPTGVWASKTMNAEGSDTTSTYASYYSMYADSKKWVESSWVDYIAPQLYWENGHEKSDFTALLNWWSDIVAGADGVKLYIGLADYRAIDAEADSPWYEGREINRQMNLCNGKENVDGMIHFRYALIADSPEMLQVLERFYSWE